jgi:hypothetical protein
MSVLAYVKKSGTNDFDVCGVSHASALRVKRLHPLTIDISPIATANSLSRIRTPTALPRM